jgi:hypothetical protein
MDPSHLTDCKNPQDRPTPTFGTVPLLWGNLVRKPHGGALAPDVDGMASGNSQMRSPLDYLNSGMRIVTFPTLWPLSAM